MVGLKALHIVPIETSVLVCLLQEGKQVFLHGQQVVESDKDVLLPRTLLFHLVPMGYHPAFLHTGGHLIDLRQFRMKCVVDRLHAAPNRFVFLADSVLRGFARALALVEQRLQALAHIVVYLQPLQVLCLNGIVEKLVHRLGRLGGIAAVYVVEVSEQLPPPTIEHIQIEGLYFIVFLVGVFRLKSLLLILVEVPSLLCIDAIQAEYRLQLLDGGHRAEAVEQIGQRGDSRQQNSAGMMLLFVLFEDVFEYYPRTP